MVKPVTVRITIEKIENTYIATAIDYVGVLSVARDPIEKQAIFKVKTKVEQALEQPIIFRDAERMY
jgi:hypothetical protein